MKRDYQALCRATEIVAREAGAYIAQQRKTFSVERIEYKGEQNLVSYVDKTSEELIVARLSAILPEAAFLAEEAHNDERSIDRQRLMWIIDPLDGTTNFTHGMPPYAVSIALVEGGEVVVGVIYEITCGECFSAWKGSDCYLNGEVVRVSEIDSVKRSLVITGLAHDKEGIVEGHNRAFDYFNRHSNGTRRLGSAATDLAYVAAGRAECFFQQNLAPWDVAAGALLVERAGGVVVDYDGGENYVFGRSIIATNDKANKEFYSILCELS